jgi:type I restriction-modification system DNA methylase subunit
MDKEQARLKVAALVERFHSLSYAQVQRDYQEANTRKDFILPLFEALGWDTALVDEVFEERRAASGAVDYAFRIRGVSRFYLEAKPLRAELSSNPDWVKQAVTYAYSKGIPWVVLTNFKELWAFSGDVQPQRFLTLAADRYVEDFDLLNLLSKEAVEQGLLEKEAAKYGAFPPKVSVERRLYEQLSQWRERLFNQLHQYRRDLSFSLVDETVQRLFNRLIFIRTCEDRKIEEPVLLPLLRQFQGRSLRDGLWEALRKAFAEFDRSYDSELFSFHALDQQGFFQDDSLAEVIQGLYQPSGGLVTYDFSLIDADVLGRVYEQYLGHVAQAVRQRYREYQLSLERGFSSEQAPEEAIEVIERPQRRRAQGIYYTPRWVVDYIVRQTVGRFIQEHKNRPDAIHNLRILDPACGSGSFLIRAYDELLQYHAQGRPPEWVFTDDRLAILRNNIFGVDLDPQAVEIARLNLLLRAVRERQLLPELAGNIKVGNSLISGGEAELRPLFGDAWRDKRPFNWKEQFPGVVDEEGFDVVIGNPPYERIQRIDRTEADYFRSHFDSAHGSFDISILLLEQALNLIKPGGRLGFITSGKFLKTEYGKRIQQYLRSQATVEIVADLSGLQVFGDATNYPVIMVAQKGVRSASMSYIWAGNDPYPTEPALSELPTVKVEQSAITQGVWPPAHGSAKTLMEKLEAESIPLGKLAKSVFTGLQTSADTIYHLSLVSYRNSGGVLVRNRQGEERALEPDLLKPLLAGKNIERYVAQDTGDVLLFPYHVNSGKAALISVDDMPSKYPATWQYLRDHEAELRRRERGKMDHERWYAYVYPKNLALHDFPKLAVPRLVHRLEAYYDAKGRYYLDNVDVGGVILQDDSHPNYLLILGLLNSRLMDWYFQRISAPFRGGFRSANRQFLDPLPIRQLDLTDPTDRQVHDAIVARVGEMLALQDRLSPVRNTPCTERDDLLREVERKDREIDNLVYNLYDLTGEERRLVEGQE